MSDYTCAKCGGTDYDKKEIRTEGGALSAMFDVSTNRFDAISCTRCGYTDLYRKDVSGAAKIFDFLVS